MCDKVIVTNEGALRAKYRSPGWRAIRKALSALISADKKRGLVTRYVAIDNSRTMRKLHGAAVTSVRNCRQNKQAIDAVWKSLEPDYLMIVGATDVVPHQDMSNPAYQAGDDDDRVAYGDLPYACDAVYSRDVTKLIGPTRVVSRLPDMNGGSDPAHLLKLLATAATWRTRGESDYQPYFGLSARQWHGSTELSLSNIFGSATALKLSPSDGPKFPPSVLGRRAHFINCHGGAVDPNFYGQKGNSYPIALSSLTTKGLVAKGTVAAAECCYGGELYAAERLGVAIPICQSYLAQGAYGYFGSTTIAYGPADGNGAADILTQQFLIEILQGASVGRAALAARQAYVAQTGQMDPVDLKTLAQFCVYGDPSTQPVAPPTPTSVPRATDADVANRAGRQERRAKLAARGRMLLEEKPTASRTDDRARVAPSIRKVLRGIARGAGVGGDGFVAFRVKQKRASARGKALAHADRYHVLITGPSGDAVEPVVRKVAIVAKQTGNRIVGYRVYYAR
jgi:hypothetical protein